MADSMVASFWGPVTSTTELCEENYAHSSYIAEFYNTISNVPCVLLALIGLVNAFRQGFEKRFSVLHISNMILAIGSMIFHATLQLVLQQSDETPMVWEILLYMYVLYSPDWHYRSTMPTFLFLYGAAFAVVHFFARFQFVFKLHYIGLCFLCIPRMYKYYIQTKDVAAKRLAKLWVLTLTLGTLCWLVDRIFCKKLSHCAGGRRESPTFLDFCLMSRSRNQRRRGNDLSLLNTDATQSTASKLMSIPHPIPHPMCADKLWHFCIWASK
uniref:Alkaline ceramidase 3 n=2 Tax=Zea mays TaxID=4577 RepID=A0A804P8Z6_MAIZE